MKRNTFKKFIFTLFIMACFLLASGVSIAASMNDLIQDFKDSDDLINSVIEIGGEEVRFYNEWPEESISLTPLGEPISEEELSILTNTRCTTCTHFRRTRISGPTRVLTNTNLGWHPHFGSFQRVSSYWFSTSRTVSFNASLNLGVVEVSIAADGGGSGTSVNVRPNGNNYPWTRPRVQGNVNRSVYRVEEIVNGSGQVIRTWNENVHVVNGQYIRIMNQDGTCNVNCN